MAAFTGGTSIKCFATGFPPAPSGPYLLLMKKQCRGWSEWKSRGAAVHSGFPNEARIQSYQLDAELNNNLATRRQH